MGRQTSLGNEGIGVRLMQPKYIEVVGLFTPRGGISIYPFANYGQPGTKYEQLAEQRLLQRQMV